MITYVNSKDAKLFELAAADLGLQSLDVDQYLSRLAELKAISPKYVRLPLYEDGHEDEEIFEIDANARTIKVPASFSKNGVGVVSDELAETVWFKINRYFDIKDFGKAAGVIGDELKDGNLHILIQWEAPDGAKGASWAYAIDADTDPDYVYFGWALTAEHLTAQAGNIRFAVRILQYEESEVDKIAYSFATQAATVAVKPSLSFDLTEQDVPIESVADKIASRLMGGQIAHCPVFSQDLSAYVLNLEVPEGAEEGALPQTTLEIVAAAPEGDSFDAVAYKWYKKGQGDDDFVQIAKEYTPALTVTAAGQYYVVVFGMKKIVDSKEYIYDGVSEEVLYTQEDLDAYRAEHGADAEPDWAIGDVKVPAGTHYDEFKYHTSVASSKSVVCTIPSPIKLAITEEMAEKLIIGQGAQLILGIERQTIDGEPVGEVELKIEKTASAEKDLDLTTAEFVLVGEPTEGTEAQPEKWVYNSESYDTEALAQAAADADQGVEAGEGDYTGITHVDAVPASEGTPGVDYLVEGSVVTIDMSKAAEGYYRITVMNKLNGVHEDTESAVICRVVKPAAINDVNITLVAADGNAPQDAQGSVFRRDKLQATVDLEGLLSDELLLQWYEVVSVQDPEEAADAKDTAIEGATGAEYVPTKAGDYYFIATNKVEDSVIEKASSPIHFNA